MTKVCIIPTWKKADRADGGIRRVSEAQWKYLPKFGIEPVYSMAEADVIHTHGTARVKVSDKPIVNSNHGLYWSSYDWPAWAYEANTQVVQAMIQAVAHTAPSQWVANALRRGMAVYPEVIYHGVDYDFWKPPEDEYSNYILWNKARTDPVSNHEDMQKLAAVLGGIQFMSTIGKSTSNVNIIGVMPVDKMFDWVQHAGLYLATARETFGIGTLEALSCGVPVVGWDWGGQREIIKHGETGFLAKLGDYEALAEGARWAIDNRKELSANCRQDVIERWGWEHRIEQYANLYKRTLAWWDAPEVKVSVLVTAHNLAQYLGDCLRSVAEQGFEDWECIIVDDCSTDHTPAIAKEWVDIDKRFKYFKTPKNLKLSGARNYGVKQCKGRYIIPLDADDLLAQNALYTLSHALDGDPNIHIAYGHLDTIKEDGTNRTRSSWPFEAYSWYGQMAHLNQLPYSSMIRREVFERTGGYRIRNWRAEDAEFWIRATSFGFRAAKVTQASTLIYRWRPDSKTQGEDGDGDWTAWFPWRLGAETGREGMRIFRGLRGASHPRPDLVPWGTQGFAPKDFWPVPHHFDPFVSIVIPVGPKHGAYVIDALDSIMGQTFTGWECIVVNATGEKWLDGFASPVAGAPWAKVVDAGKQLMPAAARNLGAKYASGRAILWLDADDILLPHALEEMMEIHIGTEGGLVYTDWLRGDGDPESKALTLYKSRDFVCGEVIRQMGHAMMCLVPKWAHEKINGFDETLPGWEDWDYLIALQEAGVCSYRLEKPGFVYRFFAGSIREDSFGKHAEIIPILKEKWGDYAKGKKKMGCGGCPGKRRVTLRPEEQVVRQAKDAPEDAILLEYQGPRDGKVIRRGPATGTNYNFKKGQQKYVMIADAEHFLRSVMKGGPEFLRVAQPAELPAAKAETFTQAAVVEAQAPPEFPKMFTEEEASRMFEALRKEPVLPKTVKELKAAVGRMEDDVLLNWLTQERAKEKPRVTALKAIEAELNKRGSDEQTT